MTDPMTDIGPDPLLRLVRLAPRLQVRPAALAFLDTVSAPQGGTAGPAVVVIVEPLWQRLKRGLAAGDTPAQVSADWARWVDWFLRGSGAPPAQALVISAATRPDALADYLTRHAGLQVSAPVPQETLLTWDDALLMALVEILISANPDLAARAADLTGRAAALPVCAPHPADLDGLARITALLTAEHAATQVLKDQTALQADEAERLYLWGLALATQREQMRYQSEQMRAERDKAGHQAEQATARQQTLEKELAAFVQSTSWRVTAPLRRIRLLLARMRRPAPINHTPL